MKVLITGGKGQLARALIDVLDEKNFALSTPAREAFDITDPHVLHKIDADCVINTAAYTAVDKAETEKDLALNVNFLGTQNLSQACADKNIPLIHLSTDYIFPGYQTTPYNEEDQPEPINYYGQSKLLGEEALQRGQSNFIILRVSGLYSEHGHNFVKSILRLAQEKEQLTIVQNQITCPTYTYDIAQTIKVLLNQLHQLKFGETYHYCSMQPISWFHFAEKIIRIAKTFSSLKLKQLIPIDACEYPTPAKRPLYSVLNCDKIVKLFNVPQPNEEKNLRHIISRLMG